MIRKNYMISDELAGKIEEEARIKGLSKSEILRRALEMYFAKVRKDRKDSEYQPIRGEK